MTDVARSEDAQHSHHSHGGHVKREAAVAAYDVVDDAMAVDVAAVVIGMTIVAVIISAASLTVPPQSKPSFGGKCNGSNIGRYAESVMRDCIFTN